MKTILLAQQSQPQNAFFWVSVLLLISLCICLTVIVRLRKTKLMLETERNDFSDQLAKLHLRFKDVIDIEAAKRKVVAQITELEHALETQKQNQVQELAALAADKNDEQIVLQKLKAETAQLKNQIELYQAEQVVIDCGHYQPVYDYDISQKYKDALDQSRVKQKDMLKAEQAATCSTTWTVNGSVAEGRKSIKQSTRLMLRAFNGEADAIIANVRWNNVDRMIERLEGVYQAINKLGEVQSIRIERTYFQLKLEELRLAHEYQEKVQLEKEDQRRAREQMREEERAQREIEKALKDAEDEEGRYQKALERAREEMAKAQGEEAGRMNAKILSLEEKLHEAQEQKARAVSRAQLTKSGHVYVISNIGSFGEGCFKIGMTRRLEPLDRVKELGDASVPFEFDVHAMIYTENAPELEGILHEKFSHRRVNLVNERKEFFQVGIDEIAEIVRAHSDKIEVLRVPEARAYRETLALRKQATPGSPS
jgi:hypothetical protein